MGSAALVLVDGATPLRPEPALFEAMLEGWRRQQLSRRLSGSLIDGRERIVRRFAEFGGWPWEWTSAQVEAWTAAGGWAHSTVRSYQGALAVFLAHVCDPRYGWIAECEQRVGARPVQVCHEDNLAVHVADSEGRPERRPLTREELQAFFDAADDLVNGRRPRGARGGWPRFATPACSRWSTAGGRAAGGGDAGRGRLRGNPAAPELGRFGVLHVRYGKAMRGSPPRRRAVATVMPWAAETLAQYLQEARPHYGCDRTRRSGDRTRWTHLTPPDRCPVRPVPQACRAPDDLSVHSLRHSYVSHLIEDGTDPLFVQRQVGHSWASTTAVYTTVGADARNRMLKAALARAYQKDGDG